MAHAQRADVLDVLSARYCDEKVQNQQSTQSSEVKKQQIPGLLNQSDLSLSGILSVAQPLKPVVQHHIKSSLVSQRNPRNNIP